MPFFDTGQVLEPAKDIDFFLPREAESVTALTPAAAFIGPLGLNAAIRSRRLESLRL